MKAGLLREILEFREEVKSQDLNGFDLQGFAPEDVCCCRQERSECHGAIYR